MGERSGRDLDYRAGELRMRGYVASAADDGSPRPGILIVPDAFGLDSYCIDVAEQLGAQGFVALAMDLWGERRQFADGAEVRNAVAALAADGEGWMARVAAAHAALLSQPGVDARRIAAIGYCLGGATVLEYARRGAEVAGVVSFHGGLDLVGKPWERDRVRAKLLVCTGAEDPLVPWTLLSDFQAQLRAAGVNWEIDVYGNARHSFTRPDAALRGAPERSAHDPQAHRRSWRALNAFLGELFDRDP